MEENQDNSKAINLKLYIKTNVNQQNVDSQLRLVSYIVFLKLKIKEINFASIHLFGDYVFYISKYLLSLGI